MYSCWHCSAEPLSSSPNTGCSDVSKTTDGLVGRPEAMLQILPLCFMEIPYNIALVFLPLCSNYAPFIPQFRRTFNRYFYTRLPHGARCTGIFLLRVKSDTFGTLSLSRTVDTEVSFSSPSLTFNLWLESVNTLLEHATYATNARWVAIVCFN